MEAFIQVPVILFDRAVYPRCFGVSENAFKLYILGCATVNWRTQTYLLGPDGAMKYLGLTEDAYEVAQRELLASGLVVRYRQPAMNNAAGEESKLQVWRIPDPPLVKIQEDGSTVRLYTPHAERQKEPPLAFYRRWNPLGFISVPKDFVYIPGSDEMDIALGPLAKLSVDEIYCYFNLLWQNREYWFGIDPNYARQDLHRPHDDELPADMSMGEYIARAKRVPRLSRVLLERTGQPRGELIKILSALITEHGLFRWDLVVAENVRFDDERRGKHKSQLKPLFYVDPEKDAGRNLIEVINGDPRRTLIAQLRSTLSLWDVFEETITRNRARLRLPQNTHGSSDERSEP